MNNCDYNQAFDILNHVYPNDGIKEPVKNSAYTGTVSLIKIYSRIYKMPTCF